MFKTESHITNTRNTKMVLEIQGLLERQLNYICLQPFTVLSFILFLFFLYRWLNNQYFAMKNIPPSPPKLPILGNLHQLGTHPHRSLRSMSEKYGELMLLHIGSAPFLIVSSARAASEVMRTHDVIFSNRPISRSGKKLLYKCKDVAAAPYGEHWRHMKSICVLQLLNNKRVRSFSNVRKQETALLMEQIKHSASSSSPVNLSTMFMSFTTDVLCRVAFGRKYNEKVNGTDFKMLMQEFMELLGRFQVGDFIPWLAWINRVDGWDAKVESIAKQFDQFLEQIVKTHEDRLMGLEKGQYSESNDSIKDFVDVLLDIQKDTKTGFQMDRDSIKGLILDMFAGGTDTTSAVLEWAMTELLRHPTVMQKLQSEVRGITGGKPEVEEDDLEQMKYLKAVIKEALRLYPSVPLLVPRHSTQDAKINGYEIPTGTSAMINAWAIHRDPAFWDEPEKFNPDRFLNTPIDFRGQDFHLIPFGAGRRMCPGISFAMANNELVLANLMYQFDWALPDGMNGDTLDMSECIGLTIHRENPLLAVATARNN